MCYLLMIGNSMIGCLHGVVLRNNGKIVLMDVQGVGYEVTVPVNVAESCPIQSTVTLYTHMHVRENEVALYGFENEEKLEFFRLLLTVSGVGPKMGIEILSTSLPRIKQAIVEQDKSFLTSIRGIGEKLASRILLELKGKVRFDVDQPGLQSSRINMDVVVALEHLGYEKGKIIRLMQALETPIVDEEELVKYCLQHL